MLVSYDVSTVNTAGKSRLRRIAKACQNWGIRVQNSVFECNVSPAQWIQLRAELERMFNKYLFHLGKRNQEDLTAAIEGFEAQKQP